MNPDSFPFPEKDRYVTWPYRTQRANDRGARATRTLQVAGTSLIHTLFQQARSHAPNINDTGLCWARAECGVRRLFWVLRHAG